MKKRADQPFSDELFIGLKGPGLGAQGRGFFAQGGDLQGGRTRVPSLEIAGCSFSDPGRI